MDEHRSGGHLDIEVVIIVAGDGKVPHPAVMSLRGAPAVGGSDRAVRGLEMLARFEVICRDKFVQVRVPEQVVAGGVDDLGPGAGLDGEVS